MKSWECQCKKYKKIQLKTKQKSKVIICSKCNIEITDCKIRNYRMGYWEDSIIKIDSNEK